MIVSFFGNNRSGKSTCAEHLVNEYGFHKISFASKLKELVKHIFNMDDSWKENNILNRDFVLERAIWIKQTFGKDLYNEYCQQISKISLTYPAYRYTLNFIGTECCRNTIDTNIWTNMLAYFIMKNINKNMVIDDVRFPNEYDILSKYRTYFIRVVSPLEEPTGTHESQLHIQHFKEDLTLVNNYDTIVLDELDDYMKGLNAFNNN